MNPTGPQNPQAETASAAADVSMLTHQGVRENRKADTIRSYDFRQSGFLAPSELRRIRLRHEQFVRSLAARLAIFLRLEFTVQLAKLQIVGYLKFTEGLPNPTHITLFKIDPLKGVGLLVIPPRLGLSLVDRMLGGPGKMPETARELSEIEVALVDQVSTLLVNEWCAHWPEMRSPREITGASALPTQGGGISRGELRPSYLGHENNSRFLQTATPEAAMLIITLNSGLGDQLEPIQLAFPYMTVEPLMRLLAPAGLPENEVIAAAALQPKWNSEFNDVRVPVIAEWQGLKVSASDIAHLKKGNVLMLDPQCAAQVQLNFNQVPKFAGRPGTRAGNWAVELTHFVTA
jgi:flagellar motor switch protein FliM